MNVSSSGGYATLPHSATYSASKYFVGAFTESPAKEMEMFGKSLKVECLAPGPVSSEFLETSNTMAKNKLEASEKQLAQSIAPAQMADYAFQLYPSDDTVGILDAADLTFETRGPILPAFSMG